MLMSFGLMARLLVWHTPRSLQNCSQGMEAGRCNVCTQPLLYSICLVLRFLWVQSEHTSRLHDSGGQWGFLLWSHKTVSVYFQSCYLKVWLQISLNLSVKTLLVGTLTGVEMAQLLGTSANKRGCLNDCKGGRDNQEVEQG